MSQNSPKQWFNLEERFFSEVDNRLMEKLRSEMTHAQSAESIMRMTGIVDEHLAEEIAGLNITVETLAAFRLVPMIAVAWADDRVSEDERFTITQIAEKTGMATGDPAMALLQSWTTRRPPSELIDAWCDYARALAATLAEDKRHSLKREVSKQMHAVAESSGGVLGFGSVTPSEKAMIERIEHALS